MRRIRRNSALLATSFALTLLAFPGRAEEGLLDFLFGPSEPDRVAPAPRASRGEWPSRRRVKASADLRFAKPGDGLAGDPTTGGYCVRVCDGYYFPLIKSSHATRQQSCEFACPSAPMAIYDGASIESARNQKGERYMALPAAFAFRDKPRTKCSCNDPDSSAAFFERTVKTDPTLRSGDVIFDDQGAFVYSGTNLVPLNRASFVSPQIRERLRAMSVRGQTSAATSQEPGVEVSKADRTGTTAR